MCEKRCAGKTKAESKQKSECYELVAQSWSKLKDKENKPGKVPNGSQRLPQCLRSNEPRFGSKEHRSRSNEPRFGSNDIRYKDSEPRSNVAVKNDNCRKTDKEQQSSELRMNRNLGDRPPPLVPIENR